MLLAVLTTPWSYLLPTATVGGWIWGDHGRDRRDNGQRNPGEHQRLGNTDTLGFHKEHEASVAYNRIARNSNRIELACGIRREEYSHFPSFQKHMMTNELRRKKLMKKVLAFVVATLIMVTMLSGVSAVAESSLAGKSVTLSILGIGGWKTQLAGAGDGFRAVRKVRQGKVRLRCETSPSPKLPSILCSKRRPRLWPLRAASTT